MVDPTSREFSQFLGPNTETHDACVNAKSNPPIKNDSLEGLKRAEKNNNLYLRAKWWGTGLTTTSFYPLSASIERIEREYQKIQNSFESSQKLEADSLLKKYEIKIMGNRSLFEKLANSKQIDPIKIGKINIQDLNKKFKSLIFFKKIKSSEVESLKKDFVTIKNRISHAFEEKKAQMVWWESIALRIQLKRADSLINLAERKVKQLIAREEESDKKSHAMLSCYEGEDD